ncbi:hypothetical protein RRF57_006476 [Xylaria bambusicola]|uniref:Uncharacterized protein n=1 Tax=Xylaria bambusicola TaxID=326684 RepID=A0AAN7US67_9PEZI
MTAEMLRLLDFAGVEEISGRDMLRLFVDALDFVRDTGDVLGVCEMGVWEWEFGVRRFGRYL